MIQNNRYAPDWSWWVRCGERLIVGLDVQRILCGNNRAESRSIRSGLDRCLGYLEKGEATVQALKLSGAVLPEEAWCLLLAGEQTGRLGEAMCEVGEYLNESQKRKREFIGQIWYPAIVVLTGFLVMAIILLWVVPQMRDISKSMGHGGNIPWLTEHIGQLYGCLFLIFIGAMASALIAWQVLKFQAERSPAWARTMEMVAQWIPFLGCLRRNAREGRILRQLGTLLQGGITLPSALEMAAANSPDLFERYELDEFRKRQLMGISFEDGLTSCRLFSSVNHPMLVTGQETGRLDAFSLRIANDMDQQVAWQLKQFLRIIEPLTIMTLAALVAGLVLAYIMPTISMLEQLA